MRNRKVLGTVLALTACAACTLPGSALASSGGVGPGSGGTGGGGGSSTATVSGSHAKLRKSGLAAAPANAPARVQRAIAAANRIDNAGYCTGGGHGNWNSRCYDCSGTVSYVLGPKGAGVLKSPLDSGSFEKWGKGGLGRWITVYTNAGHAMMVIAGLRFDTSIPDDGQEGPGWSKDFRAGLVNGPFVRRHYPGL